MSVMTKINILSEEVIGKISAGEVVERPASAVKELIENSIDAGADSVAVELEAAGQSLIRVADNGEGMTSEDAKIACHRHSTSKIKYTSDLDHIDTLGFRGEALSSIASVSQMDITSSSRSKGKDAGIYLYLESGEILKSRPAGRALGTTVEVRNLFYNVPARRKFLKKESTELAEIVNVVGRFIVAYPHIEFKLTHGDRCLLHATKDMALLERVQLVLGGDAGKDLVEVRSREGKYGISGYISRPSSTRKDKRSQLFFVNGRFIRSKPLADAVYDAYRSLLERGRYPAVVLFMQVSPEEVDVNVHPTKQEIKFGDEKEVKDAVTRAIKDQFSRIKEDGTCGTPLLAAGAPVSGEAESAVLSDVAPAQTEFSYDLEKSSVSSKMDATEKKRNSWSEDRMTDSRGDGQKALSKREEDIFQVGASYIVRIGKDSIKIIDQHAAHERVFYEFFSKASESRPVEVQNLLFPIRIDLSASEAVLMEKITGNFKTLGFYIEAFGDNSFIVQAVPAVLRDRDIKTVIYDILTDLASRDLAKINIIDELVKLTSCRAAIKAGDDLSKEEMYAVLNELEKCELPFTCPHGRPTVLEITLEELEKRFRRK